MSETNYILNKLYLPKEVGVIFVFSIVTSSIMK